MPASKQTLSRYHVINWCLTSKTKKFWSLNEIMEKMRLRDINISKRTVESDIEAMRYDERLGYNAPIVYNRMLRAYYYGEEGYSIARLNLTLDELRLLIASANMLDPFDLDMLKGHRTLVHKIIRQIDPNFLEDHGHSHPVQFSDKLEERQRKILDVITKCMRDKLVVTLLCAQHYNEPVLFQPYCAVYDNAQWHVLGVSTHSNAIEWIYLGDIEEAFPSGGKF
jgi:predicted DNA-binding transcriptional regulator YafY